MSERPIGWQDLVLPAAGWLVVAGASAAGLVSLSLIDQIVLLGVALILPLALGGSMAWWIVAAAATATAFVLPRGWAGLAVLPFLGVALAAAARRFGEAGPILFWRSSDVVGVVSALYAVVAAGALVVSRAGIRVPCAATCLAEPIVELTTVHYIYAGAAALVLAGMTLQDTQGRWRRVALAAIALTAGAPPIVALGFFTAGALPQVGGAVLMTLGVWLTASLHLRQACTTRPSVATALLGISGLAVWVPMVLAVAWACGQHWDVPALSIPDMARTHGLANALAFILCGLAGRRLEAAPRITRERGKVAA